MSFYKSNKVSLNQLFGWPPYPSISSTRQEVSFGTLLQLTLRNLLFLPVRTWGYKNNLVVWQDLENLWPTINSLSFKHFLVCKQVTRLTKSYAEKFIWTLLKKLKIKPPLIDSSYKPSWSWNKFIIFLFETYSLIFWKCDCLKPKNTRRLFRKSYCFLKYFFLCFLFLFSPEASSLYF